MIKAVVFDSDGTLINSFRLIVSAYAYVAQNFGYEPPSEEAILEQLGKALPDIYKALFPNGDIEAMVALNSKFFTENVAKSESFEGLRDMLDELKKAGLKLAIVTGGNHRIHDALGHHGINDYFESVVHCERVSAPKPDPEGFLMAVRELDVAPGEALMVGDSVQDIFAGKNGKAYATIGISHGYGKREDLHAADADYIVDSLAELAKLIQELTAKS